MQKVSKVKIHYSWETGEVISLSINTRWLHREIAHTENILSKNVYVLPVDVVPNWGIEEAELMERLFWKDREQKGISWVETGFYLSERSLFWVIFNHQLSDKDALSKTTPFQDGLLHTLLLFPHRKKRELWTTKRQWKWAKNMKLVFYYLVLCFL